MDSFDWHGGGTEGGQAGRKKSRGAQNGSQSKRRKKSVVCGHAGHDRGQGEGEEVEQAGTEDEQIGTMRLREEEKIGVEERVR